MKNEYPERLATVVTSRSRLLALALLFVFAGQAIWSMSSKNVTVDEITYIAAGYYHLTTGDFEYNMTNPAVMKLVAAAPLLALDVEIPSVNSDPSDWNSTEEWQYAREFLYDNRSDADLMLFVARLPFVILGVALGALVYLWAGQLYGPAGGILALFAYSFSPNILAHTRLATQDIGLATICLTASFLFWQYLRSPSLSRLIAIGVLLGVGAATKTTFVLVLPAWFLYWVFGIVRSKQFGIDNTLPFVRSLAESRPGAAQLATAFNASILIAVVALLTLNAIYGFSGSLTPISEMLPTDRIVAKFSEGSILHSVAGLLAEFPSPLPKPFLEGLLFQMNLAKSSGHVFFAGDTYPQGLWYLMFVTVLLKTPLPSLLCGIVACAAALVGAGRRDGEWLLLFVIVTFMAAFTFTSNVGGGLRYVLPIYPCVFILIGRFARSEASWPKLKTIPLASLGLWYVISAVGVFPHYLAYFNESIGGPRNGHKYLAESNLDWGQDLKLLKVYMEERDVDSIKLAYFGSGDASYYGIEYEYLPSVGLAPKKPGQYWWFELDTDEKKHLDAQRGLIAVSANLISRPQWIGRTFQGTYDWLEKHEPVDHVGYSILIYDIE